MTVHGQQEQRLLTLDECIQIAQERSPEAQIARKRYESQYWSYRRFRAGLKPQLTLSGSVPNFTRSYVPITQDDGSLLFLFQNQANSNVRLGVSQQIFPTGGTVTVSSNVNRIDVFGNLRYNSWNVAPVLVTLRQPLFQYNQVKWDRELEPERFLLAERQFVEQLEDIAIDISGKFFDVYLFRIQMETAETNLSVNDSIFLISTGRYNVGKIAENDLLQTELAYQNSRLDFEKAKLSYRKAREDLAISLGLSDPENIEVIPPDSRPEFEVNIDFALEQARQNRSDMVDYRVRALEAESNVARARFANNFSADFNASFGLSQTGATLNEAYTDPLDQETFGFSFQIPVFNWGQNKAEVQSAKVNREQVQRQIQLDQRRLIRNIKFQVLDFMQLKDQVDLAAKSDTIADRRFEVAMNRYLIGKIDITNFQISQGERNNARQTYYQTLKNFWVAYFSLRRATLYDFLENRSIRVRDPLN